MNNMLRIAFIAKYAPPLGSICPVPATKENSVYSKYHYDVYSVLKQNYPKIITGTDADFIMRHCNEIDYVFSLLNRSPYRNSEIFISSLAEYYRIPYLGARPNIRALAEDKHLAKLMAEHCGIKTPRWTTIDIGESFPPQGPFSGPYFVKPRFGASSKYIDVDSICDTWKDAVTRAAFLHSQGEDAIIEEFIDGIYFSSPVIMQDGKSVVLPPVKEKSSLKGNVVTYHQKRKVEEGLVRTVENDSNIVNCIEVASKQIAHFIRPVDYTRIDYILNSSGLYFIEFNICCNLGRQSAFVLSAQSVGFTYEQLITSIISESLHRQGL